MGQFRRQEILTLLQVVAGVKDPFGAREEVLGPIRLLRQENRRQESEGVFQYRDRLGATVKATACEDLADILDENLPEGG